LCAPRESAVALHPKNNGKGAARAEGELRGISAGSHPGKCFESAGFADVKTDTLEKVAK